MGKIVGWRIMEPPVNRHSYGMLWIITMFNRKSSVKWAISSYIKLQYRRLWIKRTVQMAFYTMPISKKTRGPESLLSRNTGEGRLHPVFVAAPSPSDRHDHTHVAHDARNAHDAHDINDPGMDHFSFVILDVPRKLCRFFNCFRAELFLGREQNPQRISATLSLRS